MNRLGFSLLCLLALPALIFCRPNLEGRHVTGYLYVVDPSTGEHVTFSRRHVLDPEATHSLRLDIRSDDTTAAHSVDMTLTQGSAWTPTSYIVVRSGDDAEQVDLDIRSECYLTGDATQAQGIASLSVCKGVRGVIQTSDFDYVIESDDSNTKREDDDKNESGQQVSVRIVERKAETSVEADLEAEEAQFWAHQDTEVTEETEVKDKRALVKGAVEVGIFINKAFMLHMKQVGKNTNKQVVDYMIVKWNIIRKVYGDKAAVGSDFSVDLKYIEIWNNNPSYFRSAENSAIGTQLRTFCQASPMNELDHKMLYTRGVGGGTMGVAYGNGVCLNKWKCSIVKVPNWNLTFSRIDMHELAHNLNFKHQSDMPGCDPQLGFMSGARSYHFSRCYKNVLANTIKQKSCLRARNVGRPVLNTIGRPAAPKTGC